MSSRSAELSREWKATETSSLFNTMQTLCTVHRTWPPSSVKCQSEMTHMWRVTFTLVTHSHTQPSSESQLVHLMHWENYTNQCTLLKTKQCNFNQMPSNVSWHNRQRVQTTKHRFPNVQSQHVRKMKGKTVDRGKVRETWRCSGAQYTMMSSRQRWRLLMTVIATTRSTTNNNDQWC